MFADFAIDCGTDMFARVHSAMGTGGVYRYYFTHNTVNDPTTHRVNCTHASEVPYVWNDTTVFHDQPAWSFVTSERTLSLQIQMIWGTFALTGNPGTSWPTYNNQTSSIMILDTGGIHTLPMGTADPWIRCNTHDWFTTYWNLFPTIPILPNELIGTWTGTIQRDGEMSGCSRPIEFVIYPNASLGFSRRNHSAWLTIHDIGMQVQDGSTSLNIVNRMHVFGMSCILYRTSRNHAVFVFNQNPVCLSAWTTPAVGNQACGMGGALRLADMTCLEGPCYHKDPYSATAAGVAVPIVFCLLCVGSIICVMERRRKAAAAGYTPIHT